MFRNQSNPFEFLQDDMPVSREISEYSMLHRTAGDSIARPILSCIFRRWSIFFLGLVAAAPVATAGGNVSNTSVGLTPMTELGSGTYLGYEAGLYPGGGKDLPPAHRAAGEALAAQIQPLDAAGNPSAIGKIGVLTTGMSNANQIFERLGELLDGQWADSVVFVNAAQGSMDARLWADRTSTAWSVALGKIGSLGLTPGQIQVTLNYHAVAHINTPPQTWPATPGDLQAFLETIAGHQRSTFPNLKLSFWGTREYGGYALSANNPEPYAYQSGFGVKWMIERQISGAALNFDPGRGPVTAPWMAWGPYLWADGINPRADGLYYEPRDFRSDGTHPSMRGRNKMAGAWIEFLRTDPLTGPRLFPAGNRSPICAISFPQNAEVIQPGPRVAIEAFAADEDSGIERVDFYQGTTHLGSDTTAPYSILWTHPGSGDYPLHVIAFDSDGQPTTSKTILAKIRPPDNGSTSIADDSFESGDFRGGGSAWNGEWLLTGTPAVSSGAAEDGLYLANLDGTDAIARSLNLSSPATTTLRFAWRGNLPSGSGLVVEVRDTTWRVVFNPTNTNQPTWSVVEVPLAPYQASSAFGLRFRLTGSGASVQLDNIRFNQLAAPPSTALRLGISSPNPGGILLDWAAEISSTYTIQTSTTLGGWSDLYHATADEDSLVILPQPRSGSARFFQLRTEKP